MLVRDESRSDHATIHDLVAEAFGQSQEADLVDALRADGDLLVSLVAEAEEDLIGHVAFSRLQSPRDALALAPVAVLPRWQRRGVGSALINEGLSRARRLGSKLVFVLGEPSYYSRFGFSVRATDGFECAYRGPYFMAIGLGEVMATPEAVVYAPVVYAKAFRSLE